MAYENVDVIKLRNSINELINAINYSYTENVLQSIANDGIWNSKSRNALKRRLNSLINEDYNNLKSKLETYKQIPDLIGKYKSLETENRQYQSKINELKSKMESSKSFTYIVSSGDTLYAIARANGCSVNDIMAVNNIENASIINVGQSITIPGGADISGIQSQISSLTREIELNSNEMISLKNKIAGLV